MKKPKNKVVVPKRNSIKNIRVSSNLDGYSNKIKNFQELISFFEKLEGITINYGMLDETLRYEDEEYIRIRIPTKTEGEILADVRFGNPLDIEIQKYYYQADSVIKGEKESKELFEEDIGKIFDYLPEGKYKISSCELFDPIVYKNNNNNKK